MNATEIREILHTPVTYITRWGGEQTMPTPYSRLLKRYDVDPSSGCWIWNGLIDEKGYGKFFMHSRYWPAYRITYMAFVGDIPAGKHIDHLCRVRACVNPEHLEVVEPSVNWERGRAPSRLNALKTHCKRGHEFTPENTLVEANGSRVCRPCRRLLARERRSAAKVKPGNGQVVVFEAEVEQ